MEEVYEERDAAYIERDAAYDIWHAKEKSSLKLKKALIKVSRESKALEVQVEAIKK